MGCRETTLQLLGNLLVALIIAAKSSSTTANQSDSNPSSHGRGLRSFELACSLKLDGQKLNKTLLAQGLEVYSQRNAGLQVIFSSLDS